MNKFILTLALVAGIGTTAIATEPVAQPRHAPAATHTTNHPATPTTPAGQAAHADRAALHQAHQTLRTDSEEIRSLAHQRDEALRANNPAAAEKIQAEIDQKRAAEKATEAQMRTEETDLQKQKRLAEEQCLSNPACARQKRDEHINRQLQYLERQLAADEAAAARVPQDQAEIARLRSELGR